MFKKGFNIKDKIKVSDTTKEYLKLINKYAKIIVALFFVSIVATLITLYIPTFSYNKEMFTDILVNKRVLFLNTLPVFLTILGMFGLTRRVSLASILGGLPWVILGIVDFFMLKYRSAPLRFVDIFLIKEAKGMGKRYSYMPDKSVFILLGIYLIIILIALWFTPKVKRSWWASIFLMVLSIGGLSSAITNLYQPVTLYNKVQTTRGNIWNGNNHYMSAGVVHSFLHTIGEDKLKAPKGYTKEKAVSYLNSFNKSPKISKHKKATIIDIQLEAFQDFSKWDTGKLGIDDSVYAPLKRIQEESLSGELTTSYFGGGTIDAERKILTGFDTLPPLNKPLKDSYPNYFKQQGYDTLKMHPGYAWFYQRQRVAPLLGFEDALFKENYYDKNVSKDSVVEDSKVFDDLLKRLGTNGKDDRINPKFIQLITYQNHGPYAKEFDDKPLIAWKDSYNKEDYAIINNYLYGIKKTNESLEKLLHSLKELEEPIILEFHGDHNPWGGDNNSTFNMLGINLDLGTAEGYGNYYNTPYVMWANNSAKKMLKTDFKGKGTNISPKYVMLIILKHLGVNGNSVNQMLTKELQNISVINNIDGHYKLNKSDDYITKDKLPKELVKEDTLVNYVNYFRSKE